MLRQFCVVVLLQLILDLQQRNNYASSITFQPIASASS